MTEEQYELGARWNSRPLSVPQCAEQFRAFVGALAEFNPIFSSWLRDFRASAKPCFAVPLSPDEALQFVTKAQARYDRPSDRLWSEMGYRIFGWNGGPPEYRGRKLYITSVSLRIGSFGRDDPNRNQVYISISKRRIATDAPWRASELRPLMKLVLQTFGPREMSVDCRRYQDFWPQIPDKRFEVPKMQLPPGARMISTGQRALLPWVGWLTYLPADLAAKVTIPGDIEVERLDDGGIIATLCDEPFTIDNPVRLARARVGSGDQAGAVLGLSRVAPKPFPLAQVATFTVYAGCDHTQATCSSRFPNLANFRGFPSSRRRRSLTERSAVSLVERDRAVDARRYNERRQRLVPDDAYRRKRGAFAVDPSKNVRYAMLFEQLRKQSDAHGSRAPLHAALTFVDDWLVLGAGTGIALAKRGRYAPTSDDARICALLCAAYERPLEPRALSYIGRAIVKHGEGDATLASMHLAMTALWPLTQPKQAAYRLFMADALMKAGMTTRDVWHALGFDSALIERIEKYSPDQPRVPAGNGRPNGQWTRDGAGNAPVPGRSAGSGAGNDRPLELQSSIGGKAGSSGSHNSTESP